MALFADENKTVFIDVREEAEVSQPPKLPRSFINIPVGSIKDSESHLPPVKNTPIVVYCRSGMRSETAKTILESLNYTNVVNGGGINDVIASLNFSRPKDEAENPQQSVAESKIKQRVPKNQGELTLLCELSGHTDTVWCATWSPNGKYIASCGSDIVINIWGQNSHSQNGWELLATLDEGQQRTIRNVSWSPCGRFIASVSFDGTCAIWEHSIDQENKMEEKEFHSHREMQWELIVQLEGHENEVKSVSWNNEGSLLATCGRDKSIWIWEAVDLAEAEFECLSVLQEHTQDVKCIKFHPEGIGKTNPLPMLVSASYDDSLKIWGEDGDDWVCSQTLIGHSSSVWSLAFGPNPTSSSQVENLRVNVDSIVSVSDDNSIILWTKPAMEASSLSGWKLTQQISQAHSRAIYSVDFDRNLHFAIATCGADNAIRIFKTDLVPKGTSKQLKGGGEEATIEDMIELDVEIEHAHDGDVNSVAWNPVNPKLLVSSGDDALVRIWVYDR